MDYREMHTRDLLRGDEAAQRHAEIRVRAGARIRGALHAMGVHYRATSGWQTIAMVTPDRRLGFVNTAKGVAVETDLTLSGEAIEALTVPDQGTGPKVSGAAAWSCPDVGEPHHTSAPEGWTQLITDLRDSTDEARRHTAEELPISDVRPRVVRWGLATCYDGEPGRPGPTHIEPGIHDEHTLAPGDWPYEDRHRAMVEIGMPWLRGLAARLARDAGRDDVAEPLDAGDVVGAHRTLYEGPWELGGYGYDAAKAARMGLGVGKDGVAWKALRRSGVLEVAHLAGELGPRGASVGHRVVEIARAMLERVMVQRLEPVAEAIWSSLAPYLEGPREDRRPSELYQVTEARIRDMAPGVADSILGVGHGRADKLGARDVAAKMERAYVEAGGPVEVDIDMIDEPAA